MDELIFFGSVCIVVISVLRHRYRMKLLATVTERPELFSRAPGVRVATGVSEREETDARVEALEERLAWLERLVRDASVARPVRTPAPARASRREPVTLDVEAEDVSPIARAI